MIRKIIHIVRDLPSRLRRKKHCIVIEETETSVTVSEGRVSELERRIRIVNRLSGTSLDDFTTPFFRADYLVFATHGKRATTVQNTVHLSRTDPGREVDDREFEDLIFRGLWEYFSEYRGFSSKKMGVGEGDIVLAEVSISELAMDGHTIVNPVGITGKKLSIRFRGTFLAKETAEREEKLKSWAREVFTTESRGTLSAFIAGENDVVLFCGEENSSAFSARTDRVLFAGDIKWSSSAMLEELESSFGIDRENARAIFERYAQGDVSSTCLNFCDRILSKHLRTFLESVTTRQRRGGSPPLTMHAVFSFPIPKHIHWLKNTSRFKINSLEERFSELGFHAEKTEDTSVATNIFAFYPALFPKNELANKLLSRRTKWINKK